MKFPILKEQRLPGTIDRDWITIETFSRVEIQRNEAIIDTIQTREKEH